MAVRLVVSDVDGTLVDKSKQVTPATVEAVGRLREADIGFTIISARPRSGMMPIAATLSIDRPMGAFNGATVFTREGDVLFSEQLDGDLVAQVHAFAAETDVETWVFAGDRWYATDGEGPHTGSERLASNQEPVVRGDLSGIAAVDKITFVSDDEAMLRDLADRVRAAVSDDRATIIQSQSYYLDVTPPTGNKGAGVVRLCEAFGVDLADTVAIGDQANDLAMFARAGRSIAMGQGPQAVRDAADAVTRANDADGVAYAIDHMILESNP